MKNKNIIIVDDDKSIRLVLSTALSRAGFNVKSSSSVAGLWRLIETENPSIIITDVGLPDGDALDLLPKFQNLNPDLKIIVISARSTLITAVRAEKKGAFYYLPKPFDLDEIINLIYTIIDNKLNNESMKIDTKNLEKTSNIYESGPIIGKSKIMQQTFKLISRLVSSNLPTLIIGATGTGKKLLARAIHDLSLRRDRPFITLRMSDFSINQVSESIKDYSEILPSRVHEKLSYLNGGTIFIDDVCESSNNEQSKLLNFLESDSFLEMTNSNLNFVEPRIIVSSRKNILELVTKGMFREDLYYKINVVPVQLPSLRDRMEDLPLLIDYFIKKYSQNKSKRIKIDDHLIQIFKKYDWPGNIKELKNVVQRLMLLSTEKTISKDLIKNVISDNSNIQTFVSYKSFDEMIKLHVEKFFKDHQKVSQLSDVYNYFIYKVEKPLIESILQFTRGNQIKASEILGFNRNTLRKKIKNHQIEIKKVRKNSKI